MKQIIIFVVFILGCYSTISILSSFSTKRPTTIIKLPAQAPTQSIKSKALNVLVNKCNACHLKKNRSVVFDETNMTLKAKDIYSQVFIKKRMPKGKVKLTLEESNDLRIWLKKELH